MNCILQGQIKGANKELSNLSNPEVALANLNGVPKTRTINGKSLEANIELQANDIDAADLTLSNLSNYQKALHAIGGRPNRNLLDNWYFVGGGSQQGGGRFPINQRGNTSCLIGNPMIDRWKFGGTSGAKFDLISSGIEVTNVTTEAYMEQYMENYQILTDQTVTFSLLYSGAPGYLKIFKNTQEGIDSVGTFIFPSSSNISIGTLTVAMGDLSSVTQLFFRLASQGDNSSTRFIAVKLELGSTQTLAYQDEDGNWQLFETPDYGEELAKCQRFFENAPIYTGFTVGASGDILDMFVPFKQTKRIVPIVIISPITTLDSGKAEAWNGSGWESFSVNIQCYINGFRVFGTAPHPDNHVQFIYTASAEL